jgi:hypothetical protein
MTTRDGITEITTYEADGIALLLAQFSEATNLQALISCYLASVQTIEGALWDLLTLRDLETATDEALTRLGLVLGVERGGLDDAALRAEIRIRILVLRCNGRPNEILAILAAYESTAAGELYMRITPPASLRVEIRKARTRSVERHAAMAASIKGAGVWLDVVTQDTAHALTFGASETEASSTGGFADDALTVGGFAAGMVSA